MEQARQLLKEYEKARQKNKAEWESYSDSLKEKISKHTQRITQFTLKQETVEKRSAALMEKQKLYSVKYEEFKNQAEEKIISKAKICQMITDEQDRLLQRRQEVEEQRAKQDQEYTRIEAQKAEIMAYADTITAKEESLKTAGAEVNAMVQDLNKQQDKLKVILSGCQTAQVEMAKADIDPAKKSEVEMKFIKLNKEGMEIQKELQEQHQKYSKINQKYREDVTSHNIKRQSLRERMSMVDKEMEHYTEIEGVISTQINEVNQQIKALTEKQRNFSDAASYLQQVQIDLDKLGDEINKAITEHNTAVDDFNAESDEFLKEQEATNAQIGNKDMKLKFHKDVDIKLIEEGSRKLQEMYNLNVQRQESH